MATAYKSFAVSAGVFKCLELNKHPMGFVKNESVLGNAMDLIGMNRLVDLCKINLWRKLGVVVM